MARAIGINRPGGPEVLEVIDRPVRESADGEIRIAVRSAAVNPPTSGCASRGGGELPPPWTPGMDAAGVIESVGPGVDRLAAGDEVMAAVSPRRPEGGAQAQLLAVPAASVAGDTMAVSGGAGLLGSYVIGLARERGLRVIADAKAEDEELVRGLGADIVIPRSDDFARAVRTVVPEGVAAVYDTALLNRAACGAVRDGGGLAVVRGWDGGEPERSITIVTVMVAKVLQRTDWLEHLRALASDRRLALRVAGTYAPERAAEAHRAMEAGGLRGRALIVF